MKLVLCLALLYFCYFLAIGPDPVEAKRKKCYYVDENNYKLRPVPANTDSHAKQWKHPQEDQPTEQIPSPVEFDEFPYSNDDADFIEIVLPDPPSGENIFSDESDKNLVLEVQNSNPAPVSEQQDPLVIPEQHTPPTMTVQYFSHQNLGQVVENPQLSSILEQQASIVILEQHISPAMPIQHFSHQNPSQMVQNLQPAPITEQQHSVMIPEQHTPPAIPEQHFTHQNPGQVVENPQLVPILDQQDTAAVPKQQIPPAMPEQNIPHQNPRQAVENPQQSSQVIFNNPQWNQYSNPQMANSYPSFSQVQQATA